MQRKQQSDYRGYHNEWTDQHGRLFGAWYEIDTFRPIGELTPLGFTPPWLPPMKYIQWERKNGFRFQWMYDVIADEFSGHTAVYYEEAAEFANDRNLPVPDLGGPVDYRIRAVLKRPPLSPAIPLACKLGDPWILGVPGAKVNETLKALITQTVNANGREALEAIMKRLNEQAAASGIAPVPNIDLQFEDSIVVKKKSISDVSYDPASVTYNEFSKALWAQGKTQGEITQLWADHKQALAGAA